MKIKEIVQTTPNFQVLSEDEMERIYFDALGVIESLGARVKSPRARRLLANSEAVVTDTDLVRIPAVLVEKALLGHPSKIALAGRSRTRGVRLQKDELAFGAGPIYPQKPDNSRPADGQSLYEKIYNAARLVDFLPNFDFIAGPLQFFSANRTSWDLSIVAAMLEGSCKPMLLGSADVRQLHGLWQMGTLICGGEKEFRLHPFFAHYVEIDSPLILSADAADKLLFCAEKQIPCVCASRAISGITAPSTIAGMLVQSLAETMLVSVLSYLQNPGMPLIRGGVTGAGSQNFNRCCYGAPELALSVAANTDISKWLGLGMLSPAGITDAHDLGQEAGVDCSAGLFYAFLSGADMIYGSGMISGAEQFCMDSTVMCNEIISMIKQIGKGICTDEQYLAMDLIESVGPGGEYLTQDHTHEHWQQWFRPRLINRTAYDGWLAAGATTMKQRAVEQRCKILDEHTPAPMDPKLLAELRALAANSQKEDH
jgi:trimethylamine--corrinoid protein Co-methyltransferase